MSKLSLLFCCFYILGLHQLIRQQIVIVVAFIIILNHYGRNKLIWFTDAHLSKAFCCEMWQSTATSIQPCFLCQRVPFMALVLLQAQHNWNAEKYDQTILTSTGTVLYLPERWWDSNVEHILVGCVMSLKFLLLMITHSDGSI